MAEKIFTEQFCEMQKKTVCTTAEELNFDNYTDIGTYQIYVDAGKEQVKTYFLEVDKSTEGGCITQTRIGCGDIEKRYKKTSGKWTNWESTDKKADSAMQEAQNANANANRAQNYADLANETATEALNKANANTLKGTSSGNVVLLDDVSDISHKVNVKVKSKNLYDLTKVTPNGTLDFTIVDNSIVVAATASNIYGFSLKQENMGLEIGKTYTASIGDITDHASSWGWRIGYQDGTYTNASGNGTFTFTVEKELRSLFLYIGFPYSGNKEITISNIQLEEGTTATDFVPFVNVSDVIITKTGKNILSFTDSFTQTSNGITVSYDKTDGTFTINGKPNSNTINFGSNYLRRLLVGKGNAYTLSIEHISGSVVGEVFPNVFVGCADTQSGSNINWTNVKVNNENAIAYRSYGATGDWLRSMWLYTSPIESAPTFTDYKFRVCLEYGATFTECVAPEITEHTPSADGTVKITSSAPTMTLSTDTDVVIIVAEYNRDATKVIEKLTNAITALGGTV